MRALHRVVIDEFSEIANNPFNKILSLQATRLLASFAKSEVVVNAQFKDRFPQILNNIREKGLSEINLIIQFENNRLPHYAALRVVVNQNSIDCIFLDSANPPEHFFGFIRKLREFCDNLYLVLGNEAFSKVQFDTKSCPLFAFHNVQLLSQPGVDELFQIKCKLLAGHVSIQMMQDDHGVCVEESIKLARVLESDAAPRSANIFLTTWIEMPPEYVKYAQSLSYLREYSEHHSQINPTYSKNMAVALGAQVRDFEIAGDMRERNMGIVDFSHQVLALVREHIMDMSHASLGQALFPECADDFLKYVGDCDKKGLLLNECVVRFGESELSPKKRRALLKEGESAACLGLSGSSSLWGLSYGSNQLSMSVADGELACGR